VHAMMPDAAAVRRPIYFAGQASSRASQQAISDISGSSPQFIVGC